MQVGEQVAVAVATEPGKGQKCDWSNCQKDHPSAINYPNSGNVTRGGGFRGVLQGAGMEPFSGGSYGVPTKPILLKNGKTKKKADGTPFTDYRWEAHHLIPIDQMSRTSTLKKNAVLSGWDIDAAVNGMGLPGDRMDIAIHHLQLHEGSHWAKYTTPIKDGLRDLEKDFANMCHEKTDEKQQVLLNVELDALARRCVQKILAIRNNPAGCWPLHSTSVAKYAATLLEYQQRKALNATLPPGS